MEHQSPPDSNGYVYPAWDPLCLLALLLPTTLLLSATQTILVFGPSSEGICLWWERTL